jgi:hypothetical protein
MAHPDLALVVKSVRKSIADSGLKQHGTSVFPVAAPAHYSTVFLGQQLGSVANAQYRKAQAEGIQVEIRRVGIVHRARTAAQDNAFNIFAGFGEMVVRMNLTIHMKFAYPAGDELCVLGAEIEYKDFLMHADAANLPLFMPAPRHAMA